jgi:CRP-like cAMP-binding protein
MLDGLPRSATVQALRDSRLTFVARSTFLKCLRDYPGLYSHLVTILVERMRQADDEVAAQVSGGRLSCGPSIGARLTRFWRVDSPQSIGHAINPESIAINHPDGLGIDRQDYKREGGGEDRELHQISVV